jgi:cytochrome c oxidase subunit 2
MRRWATAVLAVAVLVVTGCSSGTESGAALAQSTGCAACHGDKGQGGLGPAWKGLAGSKVTLSNGTVVTADRAYLRRSILQPQAQKVKGYSVTMPTFQLTTAELNRLVTYIESLH